MNQGRRSNLSQPQTTGNPDDVAERAWPRTAWNLSIDWPSGGSLLAFYLAYMLAAGFGRWMMVIPDIPITVWPPNGVVLALLLIQPRQTWPAWIIVAAAGELTGNVLWFHNPLFWALGYVGANAAAVTAAAVLLAPYMGPSFRRLSRLSQVLAFLAIAVLAAPVISATLGSAIDALVGKNPFTTTWPIWWLGDATGILIATPLALSAINIWRDRAWPSGAQLLEGAVIAVVLFGLSIWELAYGAAFAFLLPLPILWAALRFEFRGATLAVLGLALAIGLHAQGVGNLGASTAEVTVLHTRLQALLLVTALIGLIVAAVTRQQRQAVADLARANSELEARVAERTRAIEAAERRFRATFHNAGVGISIVGGDGTLQRVNDRLARMLGYSVEEMEGRTLDQFTHPEDVSPGEAARERLQSGEADEYELEKRYIGKNGEIVWGHTTVSCVRDPDQKIAYLIKIIQDVTARKRSDEARQLLTREVNHRSKNLLTVAQVIARQTASYSPDDFVTSFSERLQALAANQDLLVNSEWRPVKIDDLVKSQVQHFGLIGDRVVLSGPPVMVSPAAAQTLSMALHELATNAAKYGSLSNESGKVAITWLVDGERFEMSWQESGGPPVRPPTSKGFGTTVLDTMTAFALSAEVSIEYPPEGLIWRLRCLLSAVLEEARQSASADAPARAASGRGK